MNPTTVLLSSVLVLLLLLGGMILWVRAYPKTQLGRWYRRYILKKTSDIDIRRERARELYYKRLYEEVTKFNISSENLDYESLQYLADSHGKIGNKKESIELYEQALLRAELGEQGFELHTILKDKAVTLYNAGAYEEAIDTLREYPNENLIQDILSRDFSVVAMMGNSFLELKQYDAAIEAFRRADLEDFNKEVIYGLAKAYEAKGGERNQQHALRYYHKLLSVDKNFKDVVSRVHRLENPPQAPPIFQDND